MIEALLYHLFIGLLGAFLVKFSPGLDTMLGEWAGKLKDSIRNF